MPVVFSPPRDGQTLTDPVPITGGSPQPPRPLSPLSSPASSEENGHESGPPSDEGVNGNEGYGGEGGGENGGCSYDEN